MDKRERLDRAFRLLQEGLRLGCEAAWEQRYGHGWLHEVNRKRYDPVRIPTTADPSFLLTGLIATWFDVFNDDHGRALLAMVHEVREARNRWAHHRDLSNDDVLRALDSMERLLRSFDAESHRADVETLRYDMMRQLVGGASHAPGNGAPPDVPQDRALMGRVFRLEVVRQGQTIQRKPHQLEAQPAVDASTVQDVLTVTEQEVEREIKRRLTKQLDLGDFVSVQVFPNQPSDVPDDDQGVRLVVLNPTAAHAVDGQRSEATSLASRILGDSGDGPRRGKNLLVFVAASADVLPELQAATRDYLASASTDGDEATAGIGEPQEERSRHEPESQRVDELVAATFDFVLVPLEPTETQAFQWQVTRLGGEGRLGTRVSEHLIAQGELEAHYEGTYVRVDIDRHELWSEDGDVSVGELWSHYARHIHMPRLASLAVLSDAISDGVASDSWSHETYAYQEASDGKGWLSVKTGQPVNPAPDGLLVHPDSVSTS